MEQHKGEIADLVAETKDWVMSPRRFGLGKDGQRNKEESIASAIGTIPDEHLEDEKNKKRYLDAVLGDLAQNETVEDSHFFWVAPPFACLVLDTIQYRSGNVKYYKILADQKPVWIHSKDICLL